MSLDLFLRVLALCVALAGVETLHGIARTVLLAPRIGKARAVQLSVVSGTLLAFGVCALLVPGIGLQGARQHLILGLALAAFMATFDMAFGRLVLRLKWRRILQDFNPASGNYLTLGLVALIGLPWLVWAMTHHTA
ncbi:hypothetical protein [Rubrivivax albus]|uniref:Uncharacterized protein n=1 Tax=Rubrivivax albus TaxID=2499835 RepID=A0A3S2U1H5_9BURK|nr:hypothetical protein [Rubrivivax albus]RVT50006.1 hypothetical protein ENE75_16920 [Rubrivivax albus]